MLPLVSISTLRAWLREHFAALYGERLVHLVIYGSHARGDARKDSDVDVAIVLEGAVDAPAEIARTAPLVADAVLEFGVVVSIYPVSRTDYETGDQAIVRSVRREGLPV